MASFQNSVITNRGRDLIAKGLTGTKIQFTKLAVGSGNLPTGQSLAELTELVQKVMDVPRTKTKRLEGGKVVAGGYFSNSGRVTGFYYREIGLYATDPDVGEILFSVGNAGSNAEWIPPDGSGTIVEKTVDVLTIISETVEVSVSIDPSAVVTQAQAEEMREDIAPTILIADRLYTGVDLTEKFRDEINSGDTSGYADIWDFLLYRIRTANYSGIHVGDYIPVSLLGGSFVAEIAGIDTYYNYGNTDAGGSPAVPHHIDFISRDCWPEPHVWNKANYNNGTAVSPHPWLASDLYAWLNSQAMSVPNAATANPAMVAVNYTSTGVLDKLPDALQRAIVPKRILLPRRYTAGSLLTDDNAWDWADVGKLWLPSEIEVYGIEHWGSKNGYSGGGYVQYPIFAQNMKRIKRSGDGNGRSSWWLSSVRGGLSVHATLVGSDGAASSLGTSSTGVYAPVCFRIA